MDSERLIVVSNRLPVSVSRAGDGWDVTRSAGGLATAMDPILRRASGLWIGWSGADGEPEDVKARLRDEQSCITVDLPAAIVEKFYEGFSNQALWPLFHSFTSRLKFDPEHWQAYIEANRRFCTAVREQYRPGDRIWVHDYQLMLLPGMLREQFPDAAIGFFLHIPFPGSDIFSILPRGDELLNGLLGADLIAFHTHVHLQHFRRSVRRLNGVESSIDRLETQGRTVRIQALPIGIAPEEFLETARQEETRQQLERLRAQYQGSRVLVAVDRLDYTKGIPERLRAFGRLLEGSPDIKGHVTLLQVAVPSRENIGSYQELRGEVNQLVSEINGKYGTAEWVPVVYINRGIPRTELVALYQLADVGWVSPLRDGMNLVAKEYVACKPEGDGVLVLSSFAGAAAEMGEAVHVNPFDEEKTACAVRRALEMPDGERRERMLALHRRVIRNDVFAWGERFLGLLGEAAAARAESSGQVPDPLPVEDLESAWRVAGQRLLLLDYDGTLVGFKARPQDAAPDSELMRLLETLSADERNRVVVLSGRRAADLEGWFGGICRLGLGAEHGAVRRGLGAAEWESVLTSSDWKATLRPVLEHFVERTPGSFVEEKEHALVWHFRTAEPEFGEWLATELVSMLEGMLAETDLRVYQGKKIVEVKPVAANKGALTRELVRSYGDGFVCAIGDDRTDEDMFAEMPQGSWSIHVGWAPSRAAYRVPDCNAVRAVLRRLAAD